MSKPGELPKTKTARWAIGLGAAMLFTGPVLGIFAAAIRPLIDEASSEAVGQALGFVSMGLVIAAYFAALATNIISWRRGERSLLMLIGYIPTALATAFWVFMLAGELLFPH